jgi:PPIC-type PPIASE domain
MGRLLREPLLHFLLLGAALFALHRAVAGPGGVPAAEIVVTRGRLDALAQGFAQTWQRPPTPEELAGLVDDYVRDEVLYREAVAIGLDRDDTVVRRRMRQKLEFLAEDAELGAEPTDADLAAHLAAHPDAYRLDVQLTFTQIFLDPGKRGAALPADAAALLETLRAHPEAVDLETAGDSLLLEPRYVDATEADVARQFGAEFAAAIAGQTVGVWVGPVRSGYGWHLVRIDARTPGRTPELADVREAVARDWEAQRRAAALDADYERMKGGYRIQIEAAP